jgi:phosphoribosyl 1,2-cyclic phosphate phosphodiesterase
VTRFRINAAATTTISHRIGPMEIIFLGTGSAWCIPEHSCGCAICRKLTECGEERTRTSFLVRGTESVLVDCGPDLRYQMMKNSVERPDLILITHEHGDHFLGMDDLLAFRRSLPADMWRPIPVYASEVSWKAIEVRFGYLLGSLIEKRIAVSGIPLDGTKTRILPFKTFHGPTAAGSLGYVLEDCDASGTSAKIVYTSDFVRIEEEHPEIFEPDVLITQAHWLNEPVENRPHHLSFQRGIDYIKQWKPKKATYLVHISDGDEVPGDPCNAFLKKYPPMAPLAEPSTGNLYPVPRCQGEWQDVVNRIAKDYGVPGPLFVAQDGLRVAI